MCEHGLCEINFFFIQPSKKYHQWNENETERKKEQIKTYLICGCCCVFFFSYPNKGQPSVQMELNRSGKC